METEPSVKFTPPYNVAWSTFNNFLEGIDPETLPPKIDRSYLSTMSGNTQTYLISALRSFELIGSEREATPALKELAKNPDGRPAMIADLLGKYYSEIVELGKNNATVAQLDDAFRKWGLAGNTIRKAATFYMHAAQYAGVPLSAHWSVRKAGSGHRDGATGKRPRKATSKQATTGYQGARPSAGSSRSITLKSGGTVSLAVSVDLFELSKTDRQFVLDLIDKLSDYGQEVSPAPQPD